MLGQMNKSTRPDALTALIKIEPNFWYASDGWKPGSTTDCGNTANKPRESYRELQAESMFSPSPMGNVQQETNRPFEALEAGAIPLLEKRWLMDAHKSLLGPHPLPTFADWKQAAEFVRRSIEDPEGLDRLQSECLAWWSEYKARLSEDVVDFVERLWQKPPVGKREIVKWHGRLPGWAFIELLRHHNAAALRRRIVRQTRRIIEQGRVFEHI